MDTKLFLLFVLFVTHCTFLVKSVTDMMRDKGHNIANLSNSETVPQETYANESHTTEKKSSSIHHG